MSNESSASSDFLSTARPKYPYPGLRPFEAEEWSIFFGRERMIDEVIDRLAANRLVMIHGSSGSGKSSLVRAGVLPKLARQHLRAGAPWRTCSIRPSNGPLWNLAKEFARLEGDAEDVNRIGQIAGQFNRREATLSAIAGSLKGLGGQRFCILVDQFEELFRFEKETSREEAELFVDLLVRSSIQVTEKDGDSTGPSDQAIAVHVVVTMRSEFLGECARFNGLAEAINQTQFLVPRMDRDDLLRAIRCPAQLYDGEVSLELAERLMADVAAGEDELPLIQHGLMYMWNAEAAKARPGSKIVLEAAPLKAAGGLAELLSNHADAIVDEAAPDRERRYAVERLFRALTDLNADGQAIRRPLAFRTLVVVTETGDDKLREIIDVFRRDGVSFLLPYSKEPIAEGTTIDIAHESLIRQWKALSTWVGKEARAAQEWRYLVHAAERKVILTGPPLRDAVQFRDETKPTAAWAERYGGSFDSVAYLIKDSLARKRRNAWSRAAATAGVLAFLAYWGYSTYEDQSRRQQATIDRLTMEQQRLEMEQQRVVATQNFELAVTSAQKLLDKLGTSVERGEITVKGANAMLGVATEIVAQVRNVEITTKTIGLLVHLGHTAHDIHMTLGNITLAFESAKEARDAAEKLLATTPGSPVVLQLLYGSIWRMADAISYRGVTPAIHQQALAEYLEAQKLARRLVEMSPEDGAHQRDLMFVHQKIGDMRQALGDLDAAIAEYRTALTLIQKAAAGAPENRGWRRDVATTLRRIGQVQAAKSDFDGALDQLKAALEIMTGLVQEDPGDNVTQSNFASNHRDIAVTYAQRGDLDASLAAYRRAISIQERLIARDRDNATWQFSLAALHAGLGGVLRRQNDLAGALEQYQKAYTLRQQLALKDPTNPSRQNSLAFAGIAVADVLNAQKQNLDEAVKMWRAAIEILDEARPRYDRNVFDCYIKIGDILLLKDDREGALKDYKVAWAIARDSAAKNTSSVIWQRNLTTSYVKIGDLLASQERSREALDQYEKALEIVTELAVKYPKSDEWPALVESLKAKIQKLQSLVLKP